MSIFKAGIYALLQKKMYRRTKRYMQFKELQYKHVYNYEDSDAE